MRPTQTLSSLRACAQPKSTNAPATETEPTFARGRHLSLALIGLAHAPLIAVTGAAAVELIGPSAASSERVAMVAMSQLLFAALLAWLALTVFDTHSGVTMWPRRWRDLGPDLLVLFAALEVWSVWIVWRDPAPHWAGVAPWFSTFNSDGELQIGLAVAIALAFVVGEELIYRVLLQRALEGYLRPFWALVLQAAVFELMHVYGYGYASFTGVWFILAIVFGLAFQRTQSLAIPVLLHIVHNGIYFTAVWYLGQ